MARFSGGSGGGEAGPPGQDADTGDITFDGVKIIGAGTASGDGANLGTIELVPDGDLTSDQYLIIDPTAPNHIHIRPGGTQDASTADLIIGGEDTNLLVSDTGDYVDIRTTSETATNIWRFGSDGILSGPGMSTLYTYWITAPESSLKLSSSSDQVILNGATGEFLNDETDPTNQIATLGDLVTNTDGSWTPNFTDSTGTLAGITATGNYNRIGNMVFFCVNVSFNGYSNLGTGQYQFDLPFAPRQTFTSRGGTLHNLNTDSKYHIAAITDIVTDGANAKAKLYYSGSTTDLAWKYNTPVSWAHNSTHFDMSGFYEILPS